MTVQRDLIAHVEAVAARPSTPSHLAESLHEAIALARHDAEDGAAAIRAAFAELAAFHHIITEDGAVIALSMYVRNLLDSAAYTEENLTTPAEQLAAIAAARALIDAGDEAGVAALESALDEPGATPSERLSVAAAVAVADAVLAIERPGERILSVLYDDDGVAVGYGVSELIVSIGNGPMLVDRRTGAATFLGSLELRDRINAMRPVRF